MSDQFLNNFNNASSNPADVGTGTMVQQNHPNINVAEIIFGSSGLSQGAPSQQSTPQSVSQNSFDQDDSLSSSALPATPMGRRARRLQQDNVIDSAASGGNFLQQSADAHNFSTQSSQSSPALSEKNVSGGSNQQAPENNFQGALDASLSDLSRQQRRAVLNKSQGTVPEAQEKPLITADSHLSSRVPFSDPEPKENSAPDAEAQMTKPTAQAEVSDTPTADSQKIDKSLPQPAPAVTSSANSDFSGLDSQRRYRQRSVQSSDTGAGSIGSLVNSAGNGNGFQSKLAEWAAPEDSQAQDQSTPQSPYFSAQDGQAFENPVVPKATSEMNREDKIPLHQNSSRSQSENSQTQDSSAYSSPLTQTNAVPTAQHASKNEIWAQNLAPTSAPQQFESPVHSVSVPMQQSPQSVAESLTVDPAVLAQQQALASHYEFQNKQAARFQQSEDSSVPLVSPSAPEGVVDPASTDNLAMIQPQNYANVPGIGQPVSQSPVTSSIPVVTANHPTVSARQETVEVRPQPSYKQSSRSSLLYKAEQLAAENRQEDKTPHVRQRSVLRAERSVDDYVGRGALSVSGDTADTDNRLYEGNNPTPDTAPNKSVAQTVADTQSQPIVKQKVLSSQEKTSESVSDPSSDIDASVGEKTSANSTLDKVRQRNTNTSTKPTTSQPETATPNKSEAPTGRARQVSFQTRSSRSSNQNQQTRTGTPRQGRAHSRTSNRQGTRRTPDGANVRDPRAQQKNLQNRPTPRRTQGQKPNVSPEVRREKLGIGQKAASDQQKRNQQLNDPVDLRNTSSGSSGMPRINNATGGPLSATYSRRGTDANTSSQYSTRGQDNSISIQQPSGVNQTDDSQARVTSPANYPPNNGPASTESSGAGPLANMSESDGGKVSINKDARPDIPEISSVEQNRTVDQSQTVSPDVSENLANGKIESDNITTDSVLSSQDFRIENSSTPNPVSGRTLTQSSLPGVPSWGAPLGTRQSSNSPTIPSRPMIHNTTVAGSIPAASEASVGPIVGLNSGKIDTSAFTAGSSPSVAVPISATSSKGVQPLDAKSAGSMARRERVATIFIVGGIALVIGATVVTLVVASH